MVPPRSTSFPKRSRIGPFIATGLDIPEGDVPMAINGQTSSVPVPFPRSSDDFYHITKINEPRSVKVRDACKRRARVVHMLSKGTRDER